MEGKAAKADWSSFQLIAAVTVDYYLNFFKRGGDAIAGGQIHAGPFERAPDGLGRRFT